jgi:hypothetical protein
MLSPTRISISNTEPTLQHSREPQQRFRKNTLANQVSDAGFRRAIKSTYLRLRRIPLELCESRVGFPSTNRLKSPRNACSSNSSESAEDRRRYVQNGLKSEMLCITLRTMGAKSNFPHGEGLAPEPIPPQASRRHLSNDQLMDQPFHEWHPHRMKTGLRNHPIGRKASMVILPLLRYKAAASQNENTRGAPVNDQSRLVASSPTVPNSALTQLTSSGDKGNSKRTRDQESR